jgi:flagellar biosynthesis anti-sigma factor FlgM
MKIQGNRPENDAAVAQNTKVERGGAETRPAAGARVGQGDRVALSSEAALASSAAKAAADAPDVRMDLVNRMRELMDRGELGADAEKLADRLIDGMLEGS